MNWNEFFGVKLNKCNDLASLRKIITLEHRQNYIKLANNTLLNLSSNDYLGLRSNKQLQQQFFRLVSTDEGLLSASSSRLVTGNFLAHTEIEQLLCKLFKREAALVFSSGYQMNLGILSALADKNTLVLADKFIHASMLDGIKLSQAKLLRYRHNDIEHIAELLQKHCHNYPRVLLVTESIFSMNGDVTDLVALVKLKQSYPNLALYVDEAHAIGVRGNCGLGCAQEQNVIAEIDFLVGTFGKALHSFGGYLVCNAIEREYLVNYMRPLIFSTALPPINIKWSSFVLRNLVNLDKERLHLAAISTQLRNTVIQLLGSCTSNSHIISLVVGSNQKALHLSKQLANAGFYAVAIRPPTVPENGALIRISLTADLKQVDIERLITCLFKILN